MSTVSLFLYHTHYCLPCSPLRVFPLAGSHCYLRLLPSLHYKSFLATCISLLNLIVSAWALSWIILLTCAHRHILAVVVFLSSRRRHIAFVPDVAISFSLPLSLSCFRSYCLTFVLAVSLPCYLVVLLSLTRCLVVLLCGSHYPDYLVLAVSLSPSLTCSYHFALAVLPLASCKSRSLALALAVSFSLLQSYSHCHCLTLAPALALAVTLSKSRGHCLAFTDSRSCFAVLLSRSLAISLFAVSLSCCLPVSLFAVSLSCSSRNLAVLQLLLLS